MARSSSNLLNQGPLILLTSSATPMTSGAEEGQQGYQALVLGTGSCLCAGDSTVSMGLGQGCAQVAGTVLCLWVGDRMTLTFWGQCCTQGLGQAHAQGQYCAHVLADRIMPRCRVHDHAHVLKDSAVPMGWDRIMAMGWETVLSVCGGTGSCPGTVLSPWARTRSCPCVGVSAVFVCMGT